MLLYALMFRVFDINNDGAISLKELKRIVKDLFHLINEKVNKERINFKSCP